MGRINGITPAEISNRYPTIITPAGYAFSIWSLIYFGLVVFSIYQLLPGNLGRFSGTRTLYIASCVLNCAWIYFWHHDRIGICFILIVALLAVLLTIAAKFSLSATYVEVFFVKGTFGLYAGWVTVAAIVNLFVYLRSTGTDLAGSVWAGVSAVLIATMLAIVVTRRFTNYFYSLAIAWALTAIAIEQSGQTLVVVACAAGVIVGLLMAMSFVLKLPTSPVRLRDNE